MDEETVFIRFHWNHRSLEIPIERAHCSSEIPLDGARRSPEIPIEGRASFVRFHWRAACRSSEIPLEGSVSFVRDSTGGECVVRQRFHWRGLPLSSRVSLLGATSFKRHFNEGSTLFFNSSTGGRGGREEGIGHTVGTTFM